MLKLEKSGVGDPYYGTGLIHRCLRYRIGLLRNASLLIRSCAPLNFCNRHFKWENRCSFPNEETLASAWEVEAAQSLPTFAV